MRRQRPPFATGLIAISLLVLVATQGAPARAAGLATFRLMNIDPQGAAPVTEVIAQVLPAGSVVPRDPSTDPSTILDPSTGWVSSGFNPDDLLLTLGEGTTSTGDPFQAIKLDFGPDGFAPGGKLFFQLNKSLAYDGLVRLVLPSTVTNLALERLDDLPSIPDNGGGPPAVPQVPEPAAVLIWVGGAAFGLHRWRRAPRRQATDQESWKS